MDRRERCSPERFLLSGTGEPDDRADAALHAVGGEKPDPQSAAQTKFLSPAVHSRGRRTASPLVRRHSDEGTGEASEPLDRRDLQPREETRAREVRGLHGEPCGLPAAPRRQRWRRVQVSPRTRAGKQGPAPAGLLDRPHERNAVQKRAAVAELSSGGNDPAERRRLLTHKSVGRSGAARRPRRRQPQLGISTQASVGSSARSDTEGASALVEGWKPRKLRARESRAAFRQRAHGADDDPHSAPGAEKDDHARGQPEATDPENRT